MKIGRRTFLKGAAAAASVAIVMPRIVRASEKTLKIGYILAKESQLGAGATAFADEVAKRTAGRYAIEQYPSAALGGEVEMMKALQLGSVDMAFITGAPVPNFVAECGVFGIPFLFRDAAHAHAVFDGPIGTELLKKFQEKDMVALAWGENGMRHVTNSKRAIAAPEDFKELKLRVPQNETMLAGFKALGADVAALSFPELYGALQSGKFDGQENPIATIVSAKFFQVQKHLTLSAHVYDPAVFLASTDVMDELSDEDRAAFVEAAKIGGEASRKFAAEAQASGVGKLKDGGMEVVPAIDGAKFAAAMAGVMPQFEQKFGADFIAKVRAG
jgi:tripartite ATP-independent transporter DctP family solute receptor